MLKEQAALVEAAVAEAQATTEAAREMAALPDIPDFSDYAGELRRQRPSRAGREAKLARRKARCAACGRLHACMATRLVVGSATCCLLLRLLPRHVRWNAWLGHVSSENASLANISAPGPAGIHYQAAKSSGVFSRAEKALAKAGDGASDEPSAAAAPAPAGASGRASESREGSGSASDAGKTAKVPLPGIHSCCWLLVGLAPRLEPCSAFLLCSIDTLWLLRVRPGEARSDRVRQDSA